MYLKIIMNRDATKSKIFIDDIDVSSNVKGFQIIASADDKKPYVRIDFIYDTIEISGCVDINKTAVIK